MNSNTLHENFSFEKYFFKNYINLNHHETMMILDERNNIQVRKWMDNTSLISSEEHSLFVNSLFNNRRKSYWLVYRNEIPIGSININQINLKAKSGIWGLFLFEKYQGTGWGIDVEFYAMQIFFNRLNFSKVDSYVNSDNYNSITLQPFFNFDKIDVKNNQIHFQLIKEDFMTLPHKLIDYKINIFYNQKRNVN